jgi:4-hydroxy-tetrahydrodipicolinate reductase
VVGARGKMGIQVVDTVKGAPDLELALTLDKGDDLGVIEPHSIDVAVEFTVADVSFSNVQRLLSEGVQRIIIGSSGWGSAKIDELKAFCQVYPRAKVFLVPNFSISAVLQSRFAKEAARYFEDTHIIEYHHKAKADKPSGTALALQDDLERLGIPRPDALSVRGDGYLAKQEVIMTNPGERLVIDQDVLSREAFMPGVLLAIRSIIKADFSSGVVVGLGEVMPPTV